jgi:hypothetical protein
VEAGLVSLVTMFDGRTTAEMATVGRKGFDGIRILLGGEHRLGRYMAPVPGYALAIEAAGFRGVASRPGTPRGL